MIGYRQAPGTARRTPDTTARAHTWQDHALCLTEDPAVFFPEEGDLLGREHAKRICRACPVMGACLEEALRVEGGAGPSSRYGIRGAHTGRMRHTLYKRRQEAPP